MTQSTAGVRVLRHLGMSRRSTCEVDCHGFTAECSHALKDTKKFVNIHRHIHINFYTIIGYTLGSRTHKGNENRFETSEVREMGGKFTETEVYPNLQKLYPRETKINSRNREV